MNTTPPLSAKIPCFILIASSMAILPLLGKGKSSSAVPAMDEAVAAIDSFIEDGLKAQGLERNEAVSDLSILHI